MKIAELRKVGCKIGREGMSDLALTAVESCDMSPKALMQLCGELSLISKMASCDDYWEEQVNRGESKMQLRIEKIGD